MESLTLSNNVLREECEALTVMNDELKRQKEEVVARLMQEHDSTLKAEIASKSYESKIQEGRLRETLLKSELDALQSRLDMIMKERESDVLLVNHIKAECHEMKVREEVMEAGRADERHAFEGKMREVTMSLEAAVKRAENSEKDMLLLHKKYKRMVR